MVYGGTAPNIIAHINIQISAVLSFFLHSPDFLLYLPLQNYYRYDFNLICRTLIINPCETCRYIS